MKVFEASLRSFGNFVSKNVVADTSSLITLEMTGLLDSLPFLRFKTASSVVQELEEIASYTDQEGKAAKKLLRRIAGAEIEVSEVDHVAVGKLLRSRVQRGEAECLQLCREKGVRILLTDDAEAIAALQEAALASNIEMRISVAAVAELLKRGSISKSEARRLVKKIIQSRRWEGGVLEVLSEKYFA